LTAKTEPENDGKTADNAFEINCDRVRTPAERTLAFAAARRSQQSGMNEERSDIVFSSLLSTISVGDRVYKVRVFRADRYQYGWQRACQNGCFLTIRTDFTFPGMVC